MLNNITTKHGLASLNIDHPKIHKKYEYRGNIHSYFNYKLLFEAKHRLKKQGKKNSNMMRLITGITGTVKEWILKEWSQGRSFTMWSPEGEGLRNKKQLSVINVGLLR